MRKIRVARFSGRTRTIFPESSTRQPRSPQTSSMISGAVASLMSMVIVPETSGERTRLKSFSFARERNSSRASAPAMTRVYRRAALRNSSGDCFAPSAVSRGASGRGAGRAAPRRESPCAGAGTSRAAETLGGGSFRTAWGFAQPTPKMHTPTKAAAPTPNGSR